MTDWFRSWHGAPTDPKWLGIAKRAGVAPGIAVAVAWALMDRASQAEDRGSIEGYDADGLACFFGCEPEQIDAIVVAMTDKGMVSEGRLTSWEKRQPKREDGAAERAKEWRERKRTQENADEPPETEKIQIQKEEPSGSSKKRGSRIPDDWMPDEADAVAAGLPRQNVSLEASKFRDYWRGLPGQRGVKLDWPATWRNWCRKTAESRTTRPHSTASPKKLTQSESLRNMGRAAGVIDATGTPIRRLETSERDGENPGAGDPFRIAVAGNHGW